jgi:hypothetical protein
MKICSKCGYQNTDDLEKCANCLVDLHWARVNLGKFTGTPDDTKRIGDEERKRRGVDINSANVKIDNENKTSVNTNFFTIGFVLLIILDLLFLFALSDGYVYLNYFCPVTFGFLIAAFASFFISKRSRDIIIVLIVVLIVGTLVGFVLVSAVGGFYM